MFFRKRRKAGAKKSGSPRPQQLSPQAAALEQFIVEEIEIADVPAPAAVMAARPAGPPAWWVGLHSAASSVGLWLLLIMASLFARSAWPVDETRLLAVAWEMWTRHEVVLPYLNGELFARQPPLLPWLIHTGWVLFGVNEWWPRLVPALFALASLMVTARMGRLLWRDNPEIARHAPLVLIGTPLWALYITLALPDMLLVFFTLLGWWAVLIMWRRRDMRAFLMLGSALGFGTLSLGLTIYAYVLPVALLAPLWAKEGPTIVWKYWYADIAKAVLLGAVILFLWLVPAGVQAGPAYALRWIYGSLSAARIDLLPAAQPWWWYLPWLPILLLPWSIWPLLWLRLWRIRREPLSVGMSFGIIGGLSALVLLSILEVKQPQFILPLLPLAALFIAYLLMNDSLANVGEDNPLCGMTIPIVVLGGLMAVLPRLPRVEFLPVELWELSPFVGIALMFAGIALAWIPARAIRQRVMDMIVFAALLVVFLILGVGSQFDGFYRPEAAGQFLAGAQAQNRPIAYVGKYQGEFQFSARLQQPLQVLNPAQVESWSMRHPDGLVVAYAHVWQPAGAETVPPQFEVPYRGQSLRVWAAHFYPVQNP